jgi:hypothetical protein
MLSRVTGAFRRVTVKYIVIACSMPDITGVRHLVICYFVSMVLILILMQFNSYSLRHLQYVLDDSV